MKEKHFLIHNAIENAFNHLPDYSYAEVLYAILGVLGVKDRAKILDVSLEEFYEAVYQAVRNETEDFFTEEEKQEIEKTKVNFNNTKWKKTK